MKILNWAYPTILLVGLIYVPQVVADPPVIHQSTESSVPAVKGINSSTGSALRGESDNGRAVEGWSNTNFGVTGDSQTFAGVRGTSKDGRGTEGWSTTNAGVWGTTKSPNAAAGEFYNEGSGDHLKAGKNGEFRVLNNGDVLVRGQKIGITGATGPQGPKGEQGPPGPAVRTVAVCQSPGFGNGTCPCAGRAVSLVSGACSVTSDTGSCSNQVANGCCAVCAP